MFGQKPGVIRQQRPDNVSLNAFPVTNLAAVSARSSRRSSFTVGGFTGERVLQVFPDNFLAIADYMIKQNINAIRQKIQQAKRQ